MTVDAVQLCHDDANVLRTRRCFNTRKLLHGKRIAEIIVHRRNVIEAIRIGEALCIRPVLKQFFNAAIEIAHDRCRLDDALTIKLELHLQHTMR